MTNLDRHIKMQRHHFVDKGLYGQSYGFCSTHVQMWELDHKEGWALKNWYFQTVVLEKPLEHPLDCKEIKPVNPKGNQPWMFTRKDWCWSWSSNILATWCEELIHWKIPWCWERLRAGGEGVDRGWDGWMASPIQRTWVWAGSGRWRWTGKPNVLQSIGSQRVRHDWRTEQQQQKASNQSRMHILFKCTLNIYQGTSCSAPGNESW